MATFVTFLLRIDFFYSVLNTGLQYVSSFLPERSSDYCPKLGSLCRVRVLLKANADDAHGPVCDKRGERLSDTDVTEFVDTSFLRCQNSALQIPVGDWVTLRLGEGQCDITETCLEGMRAREKCEVRVI